MRLVDRDWTVAECLQVMEDIDYLRRDGHWKDGKVPEWAVRVAAETHSSAGMSDKIGYEKAALAFRKALIENWRKDRDYVPCPGDRPMEKRG